jgi:hypothetical protein
MYPSTILTGYTYSSISSLNVSSPGTLSDSNYQELIDKYVDSTDCASNSWETSSAIVASGSTELAGSQETLDRSGLFSCLPWFTIDMGDHFRSPTGVLKVLLFLNMVTIFIKIFVT